MPGSIRMIAIAVKAMEYYSVSLQEVSMVCLMVGRLKKSANRAGYE